MLKEGGSVRGDDLIAAIVLVAAYSVTWILFFRSLKVIRIIQKEKLTSLDQIKERLLKRKKPK